MTSILLNIALILAIIWLSLTIFNSSLPRFVGEMRELRFYRKQRILYKIQADQEKLVAKVRSGIAPQFELWWDENRSRIDQSIFIPNDIPLVLADAMPEEFRAFVEYSGLQSLRKSIFELAVYTASERLVLAGIQQVERRLGEEEAARMRKERDEYLEKASEYLMRAGISPDEFEATFAPTN